MKKGDKFIVTGGDYHGFKEGETVEYVGEYSDTASDFSNGKFPQIVRHVHIKPVESGLDALIETLGTSTRTEHKPRNTDSFNVTINEEALKDDIPFIIDAYYTAGLSLRETGALLGVDEKTIRRRMKKHGVPTRTVSQAIRAKYSL